jgi:hypothetical protein
MLRQFFFSVTSGMQIFEPYSQPARKYSRTRTIDGWTAWTSPEARLEYVETVLTNIAAIPEIAGNLKPDPVNPGFYLIGE